MLKTRLTALKALIKILEHGKYADETLSPAFSSPALNDRDKAFITEIVYGITRNKLTIDYLISSVSSKKLNKLSNNVKNILRLGVYELEYLRTPDYAAVNSAVEIAKKQESKGAASFVNGVLRGIIKNRQNISFPDINEDPVDALSIKYSHPAWLVRRWIDRFGIENTEKLLIYDNTRPELTINVNKIKSSLANVKNIFDKADIKYRESEISPDCLILENAGAITDLPGYNEGYWYVQSEIASLVADILAPGADDFVIDLCAAPGTKTMRLSNIMCNKGKILAVDINSNRLQKITENCYRLGVTNVEIKKADATSFAVSQGSLPDKILIDAPCSNTGVLSKRVDARWQRSEMDLISISLIQSKIIENSALLLKPGGILVYSVCSIEPEEGIDIVNNFLDLHRDFLPLDLADLIPPHFKKFIKQNFFLSLPFETQTDGFFIACIKKNE